MDKSPLNGMRHDKYVYCMPTDGTETWLPDLEFSRLESWSRDVSRPVFTSLGLGLGLEPQSLGLGL